MKVSSPCAVASAVTGTAVLAVRAMSLAALFCAGTAAASAPASPSVPVQDEAMANASGEARHVARWVRHSGDNGQRPYLIIDKVNATVFAFNADGKLLEAKPALLGIARGDATAKGIGDQSLGSIRTADRTTPAGRFIASLDRDPKGAEILWIDYDAAIALHAIVQGQPAERRAQRLQSASAQDNRISFGCINVSVGFYESVVSPLFTGTDGLVYILPETGTAQAMFGSYDVDANGAAKAAAPR